MDQLVQLAADQPALIPVILAIVAGFSVWSIGTAITKIVEWGGKVTSLLGNHLRHDLGDMKDELGLLRIEVNELRKSTDEQTKVLRAIGRSIAAQSERRELQRV